MVGNASTCTTASAGDAAVDFYGAGVDAVTDATTCTDIEGTLLSITDGTLNATEADTLATVTGRGATTNTEVTLDGNLQVGNGATGAGVIKLLEDSDAGVNYASIQAPAALAGNTVYTLPTNDGDASQFLQTNGSGTLAWAVPAGSGDITSVGNVTSGAAFDGTQGTTLTFYDVGGNATLAYNGTTISSSVYLTGDLTGNVTGNATGSSGSCTGNATTATDTASKTGTGSTYATSVSPTFTTPALGTPSAGVLTSCTGLPYTGLAAGTDGELITWAADGTIAAVAVGTATHVLTSNGVGVAPTFQAAAGGGAPALDDIADPDASNIINMAGHTLEFSSATAGWYGLVISNTTASPAFITDLLTLRHTADGDADAFYLKGFDNVSDLKFAFQQHGGGTALNMSGTWRPASTSYTTLKVEEGTVSIDAGSGSRNQSVLFSTTYTKFNGGHHDKDHQIEKNGSDTALKYDAGDDNWKINCELSYVPDTDQTRAADSTITVNGALVRVGAVNDLDSLDVNPAIEDGISDGQIVIIQGIDDSKRLTIVDNCNTQLSAGNEVVLGKGDTIMLIWDAGDSDWYEVSRSSN